MTLIDDDDSDCRAAYFILHRGRAQREGLGTWDRNKKGCFLVSRFLSISFYCYYRIFYRHIGKRLRPLFVGGAIQIHID